MKPDRNAELQRKLSMVSVPKPPADLLDRIRADVPKYLEPAPHRAPTSMNLRIAASIILLVGSAWLGIRLLSRQSSMSTAVPPVAPRAAVQTPPAQQQAIPRPAPQTASVPSEPALQAPATTKAPVQIAEAAPKPVRERAREKKQLEELAENSEGRVAGGVVGATIGAAPTVAPAPPPPAVAADRAAAAPVSAPAPAAAKAATFDFARRAEADTVTLAPSTLFGIDMTSRSLDAKNVSGVIQHFAAPASRPKKDLRLDVDAAPAPIDATHDVVRISIDAPAAAVAPGGSAPPVASDASIEVDFDDSAVATHRAVAGEASASEPVIVKNASATLLFDIELNAGIRPGQRVATVRLHYRSVASGKEETIERVIRGRDIASSWASSSTRTKKASLAAAWAEAVRSGASTAEIARRARDAGFEDLAELASP